MVAGRDHHLVIVGVKVAEIKMIEEKAADVIEDQDQEVVTVIDTDLDTITVVEDNIMTDPGEAETDMITPEEMTIEVIKINAMIKEVMIVIIIETGEEIIMIKMLETISNLTKEKSARKTPATKKTNKFQIAVLKISKWPL